MPGLSSKVRVTDNTAHSTELMPHAWLPTPPLGQVSTRPFASAPTCCPSIIIRGKKITALSSQQLRTQKQSTSIQQKLRRWFSVTTRDLCCPTAPSVLAEGSSDRGRAKLGFTTTLSTQGINGDFPFTLAIFTSQKQVLGDQPSPGTLLRAGMPAVRRRLYQHTLFCTQLATAQGLKVTAQPHPASSTRMTFPSGSQAEHPPPAPPASESQGSCQEGLTHPGTAALHHPIAAPYTPSASPGLRIYGAGRARGLAAEN